MINGWMNKNAVMKYLLALYILASPLALFAQTLVIDHFSYTSVRDADRVWRAQASSPGIAQAEAGALTFALPFASGQDRAYWDRDTALDLSGYDTISLELTCPHPEAMRSLAVYFKSGNGWYIWNRPLRESGRQVLHMMKSDIETEGSPAGWHRIEAIRLSPWKGEAQNTTLTLHRLSAHNPSILLVRGTGMPAGEQNIARRVTQRISQWLSDLNLPHTVVDDKEMTAERLKRAGIVILGYNPTLSTAAREQLRTYLNNDGRVMVFYSSDQALATMLGFRMGAFQSSEAPGQWASMHFPDAADLRVPMRVYQNSWNIRAVHPASPSARVVAWWEDAQGNRRPDPAWTLSDKGAWMSHILLQGDDDNKRDMLAGLLARLNPSLWADIARSAVSQSGKIGPYGSFPQAVSGIRALSRAASQSEQIALRLKQAEEQERRMHLLYRSGRFPETVVMQRALRRNLLDAYALSQSPKRGELRGVWDHSGTGLYPGDWARTTKLLSDHGVNTLFVNLL